MLNHKEQIGRLDRRITIQYLTSDSDEYNQPVPVWATFATVWAKVEDRRTSEGYQADQLTATRFTEFTIRFLPDVGETMRIVLDNRVYNIRGIESPNRKRTLEIIGELLDEVVEITPEPTDGIFDSTFDATFG